MSRNRRGKESYYHHHLFRRSKTLATSSAFVVNVLCFISFMSMVHADVDVRASTNRNHQRSYIGSASAFLSSTSSNLDMRSKSCQPCKPFSLSQKSPRRERLQIPFLVKMHSAQSSSEEATNSNDKLTLQQQHDIYFKEYEHAMHDVLSRFPVVRKKDTVEDFNVAKDYLFSPAKLRIGSMAAVTMDHQPQGEQDTSSLATNIDSQEQQEDQVFFKEIEEQKQTFLQSTNMTQIQFEMVSRSLTYIGDYCAKFQVYKPLFIAWEKIIECGLKPRINSLSTYLYILSSPSPSSNNDNHNGDKDFMIDQSSFEIVNQVAYYHDMLYSPTENTVSIRVKSLIAMGKPQEAEDLLWLLQSSITSNSNPASNMNLKLRTCFPILEYYCQTTKDDNDNNNNNFSGTITNISEFHDSKTLHVSAALKLYCKIKAIPSILLDKETYTLLIASIARKGYFCHSSPPIQGARELGYKSGFGPILFDNLAQEMSDDILELCDDCVKQIRNAFVLGFQSIERQEDPMNTQRKHMIRNLDYIPYDCHLSSVQVLAEDDELVVNRVTIDEETSICPRTNAKLRLIKLDDEQRKHMHDTLLTMADLQFEAHDAKLEARGQKSSKQNHKGRGQVDENYAGKHLDSFATWLDTREGDPFSVIIDGANVAYFGLGSINYHQVQLMVDQLEKLGETPLVVMPQKYTQKKFYLRQGYVQELTQGQLDILDTLVESGKFYQVPHRCLDDYYWMLSSVSNQTASRNGTDINVIPNDEGRWPGTRPILISNDLMRDHKLELLEPRLFSRWFSNHIVNYEFEPFVKDFAEERDITFVKADSFSREIQGIHYCFDESNADDANKRGEEKNHNSTAWYFPVKGWNHNDRFCVRIPS